MSEPRQTAVDLARELREEFGARLETVLLFGSVARGEYIEGISNINVLVLLDDIDAPALQRASPLVRRWSATGLVPLLLEHEEWVRAADVFAIELLDMKDAHETLHGADPLDGLAVSLPALRLQTERELRAKLILLHTGMLRAAESPAAMAELLMMALPSFASYLRATLRLARRTVPPTCRAVIEQGAELVGYDPAGLFAALDARVNGKEWTVAITDPLVDGYNTAAERTARYVDRLGGNG